MMPINYVDLNNDKDQTHPKKIKQDDHFASYHKKHHKR